MQSVTQHPESSTGERYNNNSRCHRAICLEASCLFKLLAILNVKNAILLFTILSASRCEFVVVCLFLFYPSHLPPPPPQSCFTEVCLFFGGYMTKTVWHFEGTSEWIFTQDNSVKQVQMMTSVQKKESLELPSDTLHNFHKSLNCLIPKDKDILD